MEQEFIELDLETLLVSMGDDVATLRNEDPEDEIADTLELAAQVLGSAVHDAMLFRWLRDTTHPDNLRKLMNGCPVMPNVGIQPMPKAFGCNDGLGPSQPEK